jgi:hypothetical protein
MAAIYGSVFSLTDELKPADPARIRNRLRRVGAGQRLAQVSSLRKRILKILGIPTDRQSDELSINRSNSPKYGVYHGYFPA